MPREFSRVKRVGDLIQKELANLIHTDLKDPRVGMVTINEANVSRDLAYADIYFTVLPDHENEAVEALLNQAGGFLRFQLACSRSEERQNSGFTMTQPQKMVVAWVR